MELTHFNDQGRARMVDVTEKPPTVRTAQAEGRVRMSAETAGRIRSGGIAKGDVLAVAQVAGIMAAKRTDELIPMCHSRGETGVEMEALTAVTAAALTIYDMCKAVQRDMEIGPIRLCRKTGGRSGTYEKEW